MLLDEEAVFFSYCLQTPDYVDGRVKGREYLLLTLMRSDLLVDSFVFEGCTVLNPDICVIGAGPAGIAVAHAAAGSGKSILLIESGVRNSDLNFGSVRSASVASDTTDATLLDSYSLYDSNYLETGRARGIGGNSVKWGVRAEEGGDLSVRLARPTESDFAGDPNFDIPAWPICYSIVSPYLDQAEEFFRAKHRFGKNELEQCFRFPSGSLEPGFLVCAPANVITHRRFKEVESSENVVFKEGWNLNEIITDHTKTVIREVVVSDETDSIRRIVPKVVVLSTGGIENSRILLNAVMRGSIRDTFDLLGRWHMDHPHVNLGLLEPKQSIEELGKFHDFERLNGISRIGHYSVAKEACETEKLLRYSISLVGVPGCLASPAVKAGASLVNQFDDLSFSEVLREIGVLATHPLSTIQYALYKAGKNTRHHTALGGWSKKRTQLSRIKCLKVEAMLAQRPSADNRIRLLPETDRLGMNRACLQWSWSALEVENYWRTVEFTKRNFEAARTGNYLHPKDLGCGSIPRAGTGWHHMGGTRMSECEATGSVDMNCRYFGLDNLYIAGSSIFPNSIGYANPTLTLVALSLRLGEFLGKN